MTLAAVDPFTAAADPALPAVALALDPHAAQREIRHLPRFAGRTVDLRAIRVTRHKPGKRCVIEYDVDLYGADGRESMTLVGKIRAARYGKSGHRLLSALWNAGFDADAADGISVPEPIGTIADFRMWLQRKVPGARATDVLTGADGVAYARRVAEAAAKIHRARVPAPARHTIADELRILSECFAVLAVNRPQYAGRLARLLASCERVAAQTPRCPATGIHRDFYGDQVLIDGARLYIVDFDLYCEGEPALDIGNFVGHLTELSVRMFGRADRLAEREMALEDRFVELAGERMRAAVQTYATLTLARHVYLSTTFPERRPFSDALLELCEERLGVGRALAGTR